MIHLLIAAPSEAGGLSVTTVKRATTTIGPTLAGKWPTLFLLIAQWSEIIIW